MMIEVCIKLVTMSLTVSKISLSSEISSPGLDEVSGVIASLLGLVPDAIEHASHTVRSGGYQRGMNQPSVRASNKSSRNSMIAL